MKETLYEIKGLFKEVMPPATQQLYVRLIPYNDTYELALVTDRGQTVQSILAFSKSPLTNDKYVIIRYEMSTHFKDIIGLDQDDMVITFNGRTL
jgi:hypothetical protein